MTENEEIPGEWFVSGWPEHDGRLHSLTLRATGKEDAIRQWVARVVGDFTADGYELREVARLGD